MTYAAYPGLVQPEFSLWREKITSGRYDKRPLPVAQKTGASIGYAMTEKQGGSDLRQTQTTARFLDDTPEGRVYLITGHKWFFSVPQSDGFFTLAQTESGVSCLFCPGFLPDGSRNRLQIQRLKDKAGNRSNASSEVEFRECLGWLVGAEGAGIKEILSHAHLTRLDFAVGSAGLMRQALTLALNHTQSRRGFGSSLAEQPMMTNILADLAIDSEASTLMAFRIAAATDAMETNEQERHLARVSTPLAKFWNCKRAAAFVVEALECHGGNGFIEEHPMARHYREAPLNSVWEGSGNVICLDVLRSLEREPGSLQALLKELHAVSGQDRRYDQALQALEGDLPELIRHEGQARRLTERLALMLQGALLIRHAPHAVADAFVATRLAGRWSGHFGDLPHGVDAAALARRAVPEL
jgi:putative acyl-CoA dehydrogenase